MGKSGKSFEAQRKRLLVTMSESCRAQTIDVVIPFDNEDIPDFLDKLGKWEAASRKSRVKVD